MKKFTRIFIFCFIFFIIMSFGIGSMAEAATKKITVKKVTSVNKLTGSKTIYLAKGKKATLQTTVSVTPNKSANKKVTYKSSNKKVAAVNSKGVITAKKVGSTVITITSKKNTKKKAKVRVKVVKGKVTSIKLNKTSGTLTVGDTVKLTPTVKVSQGGKKNVVWSSSNTKVATVSKGTVKAVAPGTATITVKAADGTGKKATYKVTVKTKTTTTEKTATTTPQNTTEKPATTQDTTETSTIKEPTKMPTQYIQDLDYTESTERINNPDQGFYLPISVTATEDGITYNENIITDDVQLYHLRIDISAFSKANNGTEDKELTDAVLTGIDKLLEKLNNHNKNAIVRFAYDSHFSGNSNKEPELEMILTHIKQIAPILNKYPDTITAIEVGLIGPYGEMHTSTILKTEPTVINQLIDTYLNNTNQFPILVRTPAMIYNYLDITIDNIGICTINSTSKEYRLGLFNDGYLGSNTDLGTYTNRTIEIPWLAKQTSHLPYGGEVVTPESSLHNIENCIPEMQEMNLSYLNATWNDTVIKKWNNTYYTSEIGDDALYYDMSAYDYIANHLGYRFVLTNSVFEYCDDLSSLNINLDIKNVGFGNLNRSKQMTLLLVDEYGDVTSLDAGTFTGQSKISISIPLNISAGTYDVYLRIDNGKGQYYIQFANDSLWFDQLDANRIGSISKKNN